MLENQLVGPSYPLGTYPAGAGFVLVGGGNAQPSSCPPSHTCPAGDWEVGTHPVSSGRPPGVTDAVAVEAEEIRAGYRQWQLVDRRGGVVHNPDQRIFDTLVRSLVGVLDNRLAAVRDRDEELTAAAFIDRWALREHRRSLGHVRGEGVRGGTAHCAAGAARESDRAVLGVIHDGRFGVSVRAADDVRPSGVGDRPGRGGRPVAPIDRRRRGRGCKMWGYRPRPRTGTVACAVIVSPFAHAGTAISASARKAPTSPAAKRRKQRLITLMKCTPDGVPGCPNVPLAGPERAATLHEE